MLKKITAVILCILLNSYILYAQAPQIDLEMEKKSFQQVKKSYEEKDLKNCVFHAEDYLINFPFSSNKLQVMLYHGLSLIKLERMEDAMIVFEDIDVSYPTYEKNDKIKYTLGKLYYKIEENVNAKLILKNLLDLYPESEYADKSRQILNNIETDEKKKKAEELKKKETYKLSDKSSESSKSFYALGKFTWTKLACGTCLIISPIFYFMGRSKQKYADDVYNIQYLNTANSAAASLYFNNAEKASEDAALYKNIALGSLAGAITFFALDYIWVGRIHVSASGITHSWNLNLKTRF